VCVCVCITWLAWYASVVRRSLHIRTHTHHLHRHQLQVCYMHISSIWQRVCASESYVWQHTIRVRVICDSIPYLWDYDTWLYTCRVYVCMYLCKHTQTHTTHTPHTHTVSPARAFLRIPWLHLAWHACAQSPLLASRSKIRIQKPTPSL
jgi:hypothetical protein